MTNKQAAESIRIYIRDLDCPDKECVAPALWRAVEVLDIADKVAPRMLNLIRETYARSDHPSRIETWTQQLAGDDS